MARGEVIQVCIVFHVTGQVRFGEDVLHPLLEREVVDAAALRFAVRQVAVAFAFRALAPVCVLVLSALHFGMGRVPVSYAHIHTHWDGL